MLFFKQLLKSAGGNHEGKETGRESIKQRKLALKSERFKQLVHSGESISETTLNFPEFSLFLDQVLNAALNLNRP